MPLEQHEKPTGGRTPPQLRLAIGAIVFAGLATAVVILTVLKDVALPLRVLLVAGELLTTALACWAIWRMAPRR